MTYTSDRDARRATAAASPGGAQGHVSLRGVLQRLKRGVGAQHDGVAPEVDPRCSAFKLLYGRPPTPAELHTLSARQGSDAEGGRRALRRMLGGVDRNEAATSFQIRLTPEDVDWVDFEGAQIATDRDDVAVSRPVAAGDYEPHIGALLRRTLRAGMTAVDVGANIGVHTAHAARLVGPSGRVFAFEPNSENARLILMTRARNALDSVQLHPVALGAHSGFTLFARTLGSNGGQMVEGASGLDSPQCLVVPVQSMDSLVEGPVDLIKIDVEGAEAQVMEGAKAVMARCRPMIVMEFCPTMMISISGVSPAEMLDRMSANGYVAALLDRSGTADQEVAIPDPHAFLSSYGPDTRIEDLVFRPRERVA